MPPGDAEQADLMALKCSSMSFFTEGNAAVLPTHCCEERTARHWFMEIGGTHVEESRLVRNIFMGGACLNVRAYLLG